MGVLETRHVPFRAIIMPDVNDGVVPKRAKKTSFKFVHPRPRRTPTRKERERLQKHYYYRLYQSCEEVALCYVHNDQIHAPAAFYRRSGRSWVQFRTRSTAPSFSSPRARWSHWDDEITGKSI